MFPDKLSWPLRRWTNDAVDWLVVQYGDQLTWFSDHVLLPGLILLEGVLRGAPWWVVILSVSAIAYHATRKPGPPLLAAALLVLVGSLGVWDQAMQTMAMVFVATFISVVLGIPIGIAMSRRRWVRSLVSPCLDLMQTIPSFVYLIPFLMLFGLGKVPAIMATVIFAIPPLIRLTDVGIRLVDPEVVEASLAFGASKRQLLWDVQIPLALPNIMTGINQTTMLALSMVVIASMIGARGLGEEVLLGIQRLDVGQGFAGGIAIVVLAVVFDRVTQAYGHRRSHLPEADR